MASGDIKHYIEETDITMMCMTVAAIPISCPITDATQIPLLILQE